MREKMERNVRVYKRFRFSQNMLIIGPVLVPYMIFKGLSYSEIMLLQSISAVSVVLFEVPTGSIADRVSRKFSLVISSLIMGIGLSMYIFMKGFAAFAIAEVLFGLGLTFSSGADSAILYESLSRIGRKGEYSNIEAVSMSQIFAGQAAGSVASGFLYSLSPYIPFWISVAMLFLSGIFSLMFVEPPERMKPKQSYLVHVARVFGTAFQKPRVRWAMYFAALMGVMLRATFWLYEPYFKLINLDIAFYGVVFAIFNLVSAFSSRYMVKTMGSVRPRKVLMTMGFMISGAYLLPLLFRGFFSIVLLLPGQLVRGMYTPVMRFYVNNQVEDSFRATKLSIVSLSANLSFSIFSPLIGACLDGIGTVPVYFAMGVIAAVVNLSLLQLRRVHKRKGAVIGGA
ncbi:Arabinose efflux permease family protein [Mesotoga infera]|uniref:Arabinose efflux permease family protein n=1 Tax=Mesotoga infera TaxID=1236046 RepID=A0A7Z7LHC3_9BACT|nr:MFS transporter [Mesotoga infera]SSC13747.1 Arabinose efflux permease family protein [Mesotoga infera]